MKLLFSLLISYLIGALPTAYLFGHLLKGIDIREHGSGNVGATNAFRVLGKRPGALVLLIDIAKGFLATALVADVIGIQAGVTVYMLSGVAAVVGHNWTCFLSFKGGKGIATSLGVLIGLTFKLPVIRPVLLAVLLIWAIVFLLSGFVSLASIVAATMLPIVMVITGQSLPLVSLGIIFCLFVVARHRANIQRLLSGKESRVTFSSKKPK